MARWLGLVFLFLTRLIYRLSSGLMVLSLSMFSRSFWTPRLILIVVRALLALLRLVVVGSLLVRRLHLRLPIVLKLMLFGRVMLLLLRVVLLVLMLARLLFVLLSRVRGSTLLRLICFVRVVMK